jgi:hypothetical protein
VKALLGTQGPGKVVRGVWVEVVGVDAPLVWAAGRAWPFQKIIEVLEAC